MRQRRKKFDLPKEFNIPSSLSAQEVEDAISHYRTLKSNMGFKGDRVDVWDTAVTCVIVLELVVGSQR